MRVVHRLEGNAAVIAVEVAVLDQVFDGIHDLNTISMRSPAGRGVSPSSTWLLAQDVLPALWSS